jgi:hypothetical protein
MLDSQEWHSFPCTTIWLQNKQLRQESRFAFDRVEWPLRMRQVLMPELNVKGENSKMLSFVTAPLLGRSGG